METGWQHIEAVVSGGKWAFVGDPPLPECNPHASLREVVESLIGDGWELAPGSHFSQVAPIRLRRPSAPGRG